MIILFSSELVAHDVQPVALEPFFDVLRRVPDLQLSAQLDNPAIDDPDVHLSDVVDEDLPELLLVPLLRVRVARVQVVQVPVEVPALRLENDRVVDLRLLDGLLEVDFFGLAALGLFGRDRLEEPLLVGLRTSVDLLVSERGDGFEVL